MDTSQLLAIPTVILSFLSICACIYVCVTSYRKAGLKGLHCKCTCLQIDDEIYVNSPTGIVGDQDSSTLPMEDMSSKPTGTTFPTIIGSSETPLGSNLMIDIIFWMCVTDGLHSLSIFINWFPSISPNIPFYSPTTCIILGVTAEFFVIQSPCWHVLLATYLFYLLCGCCGNNTNTLLKNKKCHMLIACILIPGLVASIPCIIDRSITNAYGEFDNLSHSDAECWVKSRAFQVVYLVFILGSLFIHYMVVSLAFYKYCNVYSGLRMRYWNIVIVLFRFVFVFSIIRFFPALERMFVLIHDHAAPDWLVLAHHVGISSLGIGDGFVWYLNQRKRDKDDYEFVYESTESILDKENNGNKKENHYVPEIGNGNIAATPDQIHQHRKWRNTDDLSDCDDDKKETPKKKTVILFRGRM